MTTLLTAHLFVSLCACPISSQPQELTDILEISNMVFTSLFSLEMLLKLLALGLFGYIKNPYNGFDSVIVIIRWGSGWGMWGSLFSNFTPEI